MGGLPSPMSHISFLADLRIKPQCSKPWPKLELPGPLMGFPERPWLLQCLFPLQHFQWRKPLLGQGSHTSVQDHTETQLLDKDFLQGSWWTVSHGSTQSKPGSLDGLKAFRWTCPILKWTSLLSLSSPFPVCALYHYPNTNHRIHVFFRGPLCCASIDSPPALHFISRSAFFLQPLHSFPGSFVWICCVSSGVCLATPLQLVLIFTPSHKRRVALWEPLCSVHLCSVSSDTWRMVVWHLVYHFCSTQYCPPCRGYYGFCWVCVMMARRLGNLLPWGDSRMINCKGIFGFFSNWDFLYFSDLISWILIL